MIEILLARNLLIIGVSGVSQVDIGCHQHRQRHAFSRLTLRWTIVQNGVLNTHRGFGCPFRSRLPPGTLRLRLSAATCSPPALGLNGPMAHRRPIQCIQSCTP